MLIQNTADKNKNVLTPLLPWTELSLITTTKNQKLKTKSLN